MKLKFKDIFKGKIAGELLFALCVLAYIIYVLIACIGYRAYTRYIPLIIAIAVLIMTIVIIVKNLSKLIKQAEERRETEDTDIPEKTVKIVDDSEKDSTENIIDNTGSSVDTEKTIDVVEDGSVEKTEAGDESQEPAEVKADIGWKDYIEIFIWVAVCPSLIYLFGFLIGGPVYCFCFSKFRCKDKWWVALIIAAIIFGFLFALSKGLGINLWKGVIPRAILNS